MFQNYEIIFGIGILGAIISFTLLMIGVLKNIKILKVITSILTIIFIAIFSASMFFAYSNYEKSKNVNSEVRETKKVDEKITSGSSDEPIVITEKNSYEDSDYFHASFDVKNNTNLILSGISFDLALVNTYEKRGDSAFVVDKYDLYPNINGYIETTHKLTVHNVKLVSINNIMCTVKIDVKEKRVGLDELKSIINE